MATSGEALDGRCSMFGANRELWRLAANRFAEIAPRRSPVRARLAPSHKGLQKRAFRFPPREQKRPKSGPLVKFRSSEWTPEPKRLYDLADRTEEVAGSSPASSIAERPAKLAFRLLRSSSAKAQVRHRQRASGRRNHVRDRQECTDKKRTCARGLGNRQSSTQIRANNPF
jgi:hypothetical protein